MQPANRKERVKVKVTGLMNKNIDHRGNIWGRVSEEENTLPDRIRE
jgi:hypothetical protein